MLLQTSVKPKAKWRSAHVQWRSPQHAGTNPSALKGHSSQAQEVFDKSSIKQHGCNRCRQKHPAATHMRKACLACLAGMPLSVRDNCSFALSPSWNSPIRGVRRRVSSLREWPGQYKLMIAAANKHETERNVAIRTRPRAITAASRDSIYEPLGTQRALTPSPKLNYATWV